MDGWNTSFPLGWPTFRGFASFRECIYKYIYLANRNDAKFLLFQKSSFFCRNGDNLCFRAFLMFLMFLHVFTKILFTPYQLLASLSHFPSGSNTDRPFQHCSNRFEAGPFCVQFETSLAQLGPPASAGTTWIGSLLLWVGRTV